MNNLLDRLITLPWAFISRYAVDILVIILVLHWVTRKKRRRKKYLNRRFLARIALVFLLIYIIIPQGFGAIVPRARYFPQLVEAHKLRIYYAGYSAVIPGKSWSRARIEREIEIAARKYGVHPALVKAVAKVESGFDQFVLSPAGACGIMQLLPSTFYSLRGGNPFSARDNIHAGAKYLSRLQRRFNGDIRLTIAAYNAGPSKVGRYRRVPPIGETQRYVGAVLFHYEAFKR